MATNTTATQLASATLQNLRAQNQKKTSVKEATSADKKLLSVSRYYGTQNELLKDMYSATKNYNENMFEEAARRGELETYFALLELNKDNTLSDDFYDPLMYDYDTYTAELYRPEVDDTEKTLEERFDQEFDPATNSYKKVSIGKMTDRQYLDYTIEKNRKYQRQDIEYDLQAYQKESMNGWGKFINSAGQVFAEFGEGVVSAGAGLLDIFGALGYGIYRAGVTQGQEFFTDSLVEYFGEIGLTSMERESVRAGLDEWERRYGLIKKIDGSSTSLGGALASISNSFGMMIPGIAIGAFTGGAGIPLGFGAKVPLGFTAFYASMFSGNMYENAVNQKLEKNPSFSLVLNAALKTTSQAVIEWGLGKILGGTIGNSLLGLGSRGALKGAIKIGKGAAATYLLKQAGQEGLEEFLQDMGDMLIDTTFSWFRDGYTSGVDFQQLMDSFIVGAASSLLLAGFSVGSQEIRSAVTHGNNKFDIFYTKDGQTKKVRGFSRLVWRDMLNTLNENIDAIRAGTLSEKATIRTLEAIGATYETLGQYFDGISQERVTKAIELLKSFSDYNAMYDEYQEKANRIVSTASVLDPNVTPNLDRAKAIVGESIEQERQTMKNLVVSQISADISRVMIDAKNDYVTNVAKGIIKKNADTLVANNVTTVNRVVHNGETVGTNDESPEVQQRLEKYRAEQSQTDTEVSSMWKKSQKTVDDLSSEYQWIFTTDGHVAVEDETGEYLFVPESWVENYSATEIKRFLVQSGVIKFFETDKNFKEILDLMIKSYKEFTGHDFRKTSTIGQNDTLTMNERVIMDTFFNEAVFQHFLLRYVKINDAKYKSNSGKNFFFQFSKIIELVGKQYATSDEKKLLLNQIVQQMKQTMRRPILKAIINWHMDPQISGADSVLTPKDLQYVNAYFSRKNAIRKTSTSAYYHVKDQIYDILSPWEIAYVDRAEQKDASVKDKLLAQFILEDADLHMYGDRNDNAEYDRHVSFCNELAGILSDNTSDIDFFVDMIIFCAHYDSIGFSNTVDVLAVLSFYGARLGFYDTDDVIKYFSTLNLDPDVKREVDEYFSDNYTCQFYDDAAYVDYKTGDVIQSGTANLTTEQIKNNIRQYLLNEQGLLAAEKSSITGNTKGFNIPEQVFKVFATEEELQYLTDARARFQQVFGDTIDSIYARARTEDLSSLVKTEYLREIQSLYNNSGMPKLQDFILYYFQNILGNTYAVFPNAQSPSTQLTIVKSVPADVLFNQEVLDGNYRAFFVRDVRPYYKDDEGNIIYNEHPVLKAKLYQLLNPNFIDKSGVPLDFLNLDVYIDKVDDHAGGYFDDISIVIHNINARGILYHEINHALALIYDLPRGTNDIVTRKMRVLLSEIYDICRDYLIEYYRYNGHADISTLIRDAKDFNTFEAYAYIVYDYDYKYAKEIFNTLEKKLAFILYMLESGEYLAKYYTHNGKIIPSYRVTTVDKNVNGTIWSYDVITSPISGKTYKIGSNDELDNISTAASPTTDETYRFNTEVEFFRYVLENRSSSNTARGNFHSAFTGDSAALLDEITADLDFTTQLGLSLDEVIKNPRYLRKDLFNQIKDKSEGSVYRFLQNYFAKRGDGVNIDRHADTHQYIFVNDNAYDDTFTKEVLDVAEDDGTSFVDKYSGKTTNYDKFFLKEQIRKLGLPEDIGVTISKDVKTNETVFNKQYPNGHIYIHVDETTTNAELANKLAHEFRHVLQHYNRLEGGFTPDFDMSPELLSDIKEHFPELFTDNKIRRLLKTDERIAQEFVYYMIGGEQNAHDFAYNFLIGKPWYVAYEAGKAYLYAPWYDAKTGAGRYRTKIANRMADETKGYSPKKGVRRYKGKGTRVEKEGKVIGEGDIITDLKTGKVTKKELREILYDYKYDYKGHYLSKKGSQDNNLRYFYKPGGDNRMPPNLQGFIKDTTGQEASLPKQLVTAIKKGKLTTTELMRWFRSVDLSNPTEFTDATFDLLNKNFFHNPNIKTKEELDRLANTNIGYWFAAYMVLKDANVSAEWLTRPNQSPEAFITFIESFKDSSFKEQFEKYVQAFSEGINMLSHGRDAEIVRYMRPLVMKLYDGTLQSAMKIAGIYIRFATRFSERVFGESKGTSFDSAGTVQNTGSSHAGEIEEGRTLEETVDSKKGASSGAVKSALGGSIITELYDTNADGVSIEDARRALVQNDYEQNYEEQVNELTKVLISKSASVEQKTAAYKALRKLLRDSYNETLTGITENAKSADVDAESFKKAVNAKLSETLKNFDDAVKALIKGKAKIDNVINAFYDFIVQTRTTLYSLFSDEEINRRYDILTVNDVTADENVEIDVTQTTSMFSRRNTQSRVISLGSQISNMIAAGKIAFNTLPKSVQDMFVKETTGPHTVKSIRYVLKKELYQSDKSKTGMERYDTLRETAAILQEVVNQAKRNAYQNTETAAEMRKNLAVLQRNNLRKEAKRNRTEGKLIDTVFTYQKKNRTEKKSSRKNEVVRVPVNVVVGSVVDLPEKLNDLFATGFEGMADTEVQFASQDSEGKLYEKGDKDFESRLQHEIVSWDAFYEFNRETLMNLTRDDVIDIVDAVQNGIWAQGDLDAQRKILAFQLFTIGYILSGARENVMQWNLSDAEVQSINDTYEKLASITGTGLNAVKQMLDVINPLRKVQQEMFERYDITEEQSKPLFDAIDAFMKATDEDTKKSSSEEIARQVGIIEGLIVKHEVEEHQKDRKVKAKERQQIRAEYEGDMNLYQQKLDAYYKAKREGRKARMPVRPLVPEGYRESILDNPLYKSLQNFRYMAMLSNPATWVRNIVSNVALSGLNKASDTVANAIFNITGKGAYHADQYDLSSRTKVSAEVDAYVEDLINSIMYTDPSTGKDKKLFDLLYDGTSKYSDRIKLKTGADLFSAFVVQAIENKYAATHRFDNKALNTVSNFVSNRIKDTRFIKSAANRYFKKMLQIEVSKGHIDLNTPNQRQVLDLFAEAVILASQDFMHKESALGTIMSTLKEKRPNVYAIVSAFLPFANASLNWFSETLKYSPFGLAKAIWNSAHLETVIHNMNERRAKGMIVPTSKVAQYLTRRDIGKGIIGTVLWCVGALLAAIGFIRLDEEDAKPYIFIGDLKLDVSDIFGSSSLLVGAAIVSAVKDSKTFDDVMGITWNLILDGFVAKDLWETATWNDNMWELMLDNAESFMKSFFPQFIQVLVRASNNYNITYSSGIMGMFERWLNSFIPTQPMGVKRVNPYNGELETKYAIPFLGEILKSGMFGIRITWSDVSEGEKLAKEYGVNKNPIEAEITINGVKTSIGDKTQLNQYYGKLNANSLSELQNQSHLVEMTDGTFETLRWNQMTDAQRKNVIERTFTKNATYAKIYMWTQVQKHKYYTNQETRNVLKELGITSNVYLGDKGYVE